MADLFTSQQFSSPVVLGADTTDAQTGTFSRISDAVTKGIGSAAISGTLSIYNTFLDYTGQEAVDVGETIRNYDESWGNYYEDNKEAIDLAGFIGTSFVPGSIGIKALKLAQTGEALGAIGRGLRLASSKKNEYLLEAAKALGKSGGTITSDIVAAKRAQMGWAVADNLLTSSAAEIAIAGTMNNSPLLEGQDFGDLAQNILVGGVLGGVVGGVLENIGARGILKKAQLKIESNRRNFDRVFDPTALKLSKSDEALLFTEHILNLPEETFATNFSFRQGGEKKTWVLDTSEAFAAIKTRAEKSAFDTLALKLNDLAEGGEITGQAMFKFIADKIKIGREAGESSATIKDTIQGYLASVKAISPLTEEAAESVAPKQFFVNHKPKGIADLFSETRSATTGKQAYYLTSSDPTKIKFGSVHRLGLESAEEAFELGYDAVFTRQGRVAINPKSSVISKTPDFALSNKYYLDLETGSITPNAPVVGADLAKRGSDFSFGNKAVKIGKREFDQEASVPTKLEASQSLQQSTRFMWAKNLEDGQFKGRVIDWSDFALLDRASLLPARFQNSDLVKIRLRDGTEMGLDELISLPSQVNRWKLEFLQDALNGNPELAAKVRNEISGDIQGYDVRYLSNTLNVSRKWIEDAIATNFAPAKQLLEETRSLNSYFSPQTIQVDYAKGATQVAGREADQVSGLGPNYKVTVQLSHQYNLKVRKIQSDNAARAVFGEHYDRLPDLEGDLVSGVSERGTGARTLSAADSDYGRRADLLVQEHGKQVALISQEWGDQTIGALTPQINAVRDSLESSAQLGAITTALRRDARKYYLIAEEADVGEAGVFGRLIDREAVKLMESENNPFSDYDEAIDAIRHGATSNEPIRGEYVIRDKNVFDFLSSSQALNGERIQKHTTLLNATGLGREMDSRVVYVPPVDTRRYPFFAFVSAKGTIGSKTEVSMIVAKSAEELRTLTRSLPDGYEAIFKEDTKKFFLAKGQYDYSQAINESSVNSALQRKGILGDHFPETRGQNVLDDYVRWHKNSSDHLVRQAAQVKSRQFFSEIQFLGDQFDLAETSAARSLASLRKERTNPFLDYSKTALNLSKQSEYPLLDSLNEFVDRIGVGLYQGLDTLWTEFRASKGKDFVSMERANALLDEAGLGTPYTAMSQYLLANEKYPRNLIREGFQKANFWLATTTLRWDFINPLINIISTPIMLGQEMQSIRFLVKNDPELAGKLAELQSIKIPGQAGAVPSTTKLIGQAIQNFFGEGKQALLERYRRNGDIRGITTLYHEVLDDLSYRANRTPSAWMKSVDAAVEKGSKITGNDFAEEFTRFVSADVMRQLSDPIVAAGKLSVKEQNAYISSFVNRVQGNYITSQRPIVFQGTTGAAVGLFQTYSFNVLKQLFRHVENRDAKTLATFAGLQTSVYGLNGLPFFDAINQHIIGSAAGNSGHKDAYSQLPMANKELGDWLLYGTASAFPLFGEKSPSLYSRGDINPRHISILPLNPLDVPAISASIRLAESIGGFGKQVVKGADISSSLLLALEHQGWSRPLAGFAQVLAGRTTTGKGSLISAANDLETTSILSKLQDRVVNFGGVQRILGARPMDEAVALNNLYRNKAYDALDRERIAALGQVVKTRLYNNQVPTDEELDDFMRSYQASGGRIENFSSSMQRWTKDANVSVVNQVASKLGSSSGRKLQMLMGGEPLDDYSSIAAESEGQLPASGNSEESGEQE